MITIDARGLNCPTPVIKTKKAMENNPEENIMTIVNNKAAQENIKRLADNLGYQVSVSEKEGDYYLQLSKDSSLLFMMESENNLGNYLIYVATDKMGEGSDDLGRMLMKGYFYALTEAKPYPQAILFLNAGVKLTTVDSEVLDYIKILEDNGVEIFSCGTCLDFFGLQEKLVAGIQTNMYTIVEKMNQVSKVIKI